jgi:hypothetical protein
MAHLVALQGIKLSGTNLIPRLKANRAITGTDMCRGFSEQIIGPKKRKRPNQAAFWKNRAQRIYLDAGVSVEAGFLLLFLDDDFLPLFLEALVL